MEKTPQGWMIVDGDAGVWSYRYSFGPAMANTFLVRIGDGKLLVISPACRLDDAAFAELEQWGDVVAMVAPNGLHHLGLVSWRERFPRARFFASKKAAARIAKKQPSAPAAEPLEDIAALLPPHVRVVAIPHMKNPDTAAWVDTANGSHWYVNDLIGNSPELPKNPLLGFLFKVTKSGPGFSINRFLVKFFGGDEARIRAWFKRQFTDHPVLSLVPGHGNILHGADLKERAIALVS